MFDTFLTRYFAAAVFFPFPCTERTILTGRRRIFLIPADTRYATTKYVENATVCIVSSDRRCPVTIEYIMRTTMSTRIESD